MAGRGAVEGRRSPGSLGAGLGNVHSNSPATPRTLLLKLLNYFPKLSKVPDTIDKYTNSP